MVNHAFEDFGDWTISFALRFAPVKEIDKPWPVIFGKGGTSYCLTRHCGPYIFKHPDSYGIH